MSVKDAVAQRFRDLCEERHIRINELANLSGVTPSTAYSMLDENRRDISITTIKKFCDGLEITLGEFFSTPAFRTRCFITNSAIGDRQIFPKHTKFIFITVIIPFKKFF